MGLTVGVIYLAGMAVLALGLLLHIVGLATPRWSLSDFPDIPDKLPGGISLDDLETIDERTLDLLESQGGEFANVANIARFLTVGVGKNIRLYASLWECCSEGSRDHFCLSVSDCKDLLASFGIDLDVAGYQAAEAFAIIAMIAQVVGLGLAVTFVILPILGKKSDVKLVLLSAALAGVAFFCVLLCVIIYGAAVHKESFKDINADIGYSFGLTITGGILTAIGGGLVYLGKAQTTPQ